jgi:hypothetical protein
LIVSAPESVGGFRKGAAFDQAANVLAVNFIHLFMGSGKAGSKAYLSIGTSLIVYHLWLESDNPNQKTARRGS